ncbi:glycosyltransferase [Pedobacter miscanthi]|uniref:glycosyltransferase n=1 Tax=Pedobacter miscanthi TaxID=2259170 RepID=UPI00292D31B7|nr:glycosyltransferase [Pedobacter miscanthi]
MLNIFIVDNYADQRDNGLNAYVKELTDSLKGQINIQLHFVWIGYPGISSIASKNIRNSIEIRIPTFIGNSSQINNYEHSIAKAIATSAKDLSNCIVHFNWINHCPIAGYLKKLLDCFTVLTKHCIPWRDLITHDYPAFLRINDAFENKTRDFILPEIFKKEQLNYEYIDHIITVTQQAKDNLISLFKMDPNKISMIHNGIDTDMFKRPTIAEKHLLRRKYGFAKKDRIILFVGSINKRKGVMDLASSFDTVADSGSYENVKLVLAGSGDFSSVLGKVGNNWSKITFTGSVGKTRLYELYKIADVGVIPSYVEQCSYTAIEMMLSFVPIVSADVDGLKEIIPAGASVRVPLKLPQNGEPGIDQMGLRESISLLLDGQQSAKKMAAKANLFANSAFSRDAMTEKTLNIYRMAEVVKNKTDTIKNTISSKPTCGPLVSIIMPAFNASSFIKEAISDILDQSYSSFQLLVIDDGSTDDTSAIVTKFSDPRLTLLRNRKQKGIVSALNLGVSLSIGKYISRMDADDRMALDRLKKQVHFLESNPEYGMVGSWYNVIDKFGKTQNRVQGLLDHDQIKLGMLFSNQFAHPSVTIRSEIMKTHLYDSKYEHCEDYELWTRIQKISKVANLPFYLTSYRIHDSNTSVLNNQIMKRNVTGLLSKELNGIGIDHSVEELVMHTAISFGLGPVYFKHQQSRSQLNNWLDKIFGAQKLREEFSHDTLANFKRHILENYCRIYS